MDIDICKMFYNISFLEGTIVLMRFNVFRRNNLTFDQFFGAMTLENFNLYKKKFDSTLEAEVSWKSAATASCAQLLRSEEDEAKTIH